MIQKPFIPDYPRPIDFQVWIRLGLRIKPCERTFTLGLHSLPLRIGQATASASKESDTYFIRMLHTDNIILHHPFIFNANMF